MTHYLDSIYIEKLLSQVSYAPQPASTDSTLNGTLTLTLTSNFLQVITGTQTGYSVKLPDATTLPNGYRFEIWNATTQPISLRYNDASLVFPVPVTSFITATLQSNATANGTWLIYRAFTGTASGILNYTVSNNSSFTVSTGTTDVLIAGTGTAMSITPIAGTYFALYNGSISISGNNSNVRTTLYLGGNIWTDSLRVIQSSVSTFITTHITMGIMPCNGAQAVEARVARDSNSLTITGRSLVLIRLGD